MSRTALFAGTGGLPALLARRLAGTGAQPVICALEDQPPELAPDLTFRLETLGTLLAALRARDVTRICLAGAIRRPRIDPARIDAATAPLVARLGEALARGDDGALRILMGLLEAEGLTILAAHEIAPDLLLSATPPPAGADAAEAALAAATIAEMGAADAGQACVVRGGVVIAREGPEGTDAMLAALGPEAAGGILFKAPKPGQDRRADLPVVGPETAAGAVRAGLRGLVVEAGGVMVLDAPRLRAALDEAGLFLWPREPEA